MKRRKKAIKRKIMGHNIFVPLNDKIEISITQIFILLLVNGVVTNSIALDQTLNIVSIHTEMQPPLQGVEQKI